MVTRGDKGYGLVEGRLVIQIKICARDLRSGQCRASLFAFNYLFVLVEAFIQLSTALTFDPVARQPPEPNRI